MRTLYLLLCYIIILPSLQGCSLLFATTRLESQIDQYCEKDSGSELLTSKVTVDGFLYENKEPDRNLLARLLEDSVDYIEFKTAVIRDNGLLTYKYRKDGGFLYFDLPDMPYLRFTKIPLSTPRCQIMKDYADYIKERHSYGVVRFPAEFYGSNTAIAYLRGRKYGYCVSIEAVTEPKSQYAKKLYDVTPVSGHNDDANYAITKYETTYHRISDGVILSYNRNYSVGLKDCDMRCFSSGAFWTRCDDIEEYKHRFRSYTAFDYTNDNQRPGDHAADYTVRLY